MLLPRILDFGAAGQLRLDLMQTREGALELDGSEVERLGGLCLQVLLAVQAAKQGAGEAFRIVSPSDAMREAVSVMGAARLLSGEGA